MHIWYLVYRALHNVRRLMNNIPYWNLIHPDLNLQGGSAHALIFSWACWSGIWPRLDARRLAAPKVPGGPAMARAQHAGVIDLVLLGFKSYYQTGSKKRKEAPKTEKRPQKQKRGPKSYWFQPKSYWFAPSHTGSNPPNQEMPEKHKRCHKKQKEAPSHTGSNLVIPVLYYSQYFSI